jgi:cbb3-type cytochrome oxidase subunit 3
MAQAIQSIGITFSIFLFLYVIFTVKKHFGTWNTDINYVRAWLLMEIMFFFNWM